MFTKPVLKELVLASVVSSLVCAIYVAGSYYLGSVPTPLEIAGTLTGMICVWLTRTENIWCWPLGIISCISLGWLFFDLGVIGQTILQLAFFLPLQFVGWYSWLYGGPNRTELAVSRSGPGMWFSNIGFYLVLTLLFVNYVSSYTDTPYLAYIDGSVLAASMVAQNLLNFKRIDAWLWWALPVNVMSILLYGLTGVYMVALLYVAFLVHAIWALRLWKVQLCEQ